MSEKYCLTASEYAEMERLDLDFLWAGMIPRPSVVVLEGDAKVGKSFLALQIAKAIAEGSELGGRPCKKARVLYLILEDEISWYDRMKKVTKSGFTLPPLLFMPHPFNRPFIQNVVTEETQRWLSNMLKETDPEMVVIDPLREIHSLEEQESTAMKIVGDALTMLFHGRTLLILHHTRKYTPDPANPQPPNVITAGRGSSYIAGKASAIWMLWKAREQDTHGLFLGKPRFDKSFRIDLEQRDPGLWHWTTEQSIPIENLPPDVLLGNTLSREPSPPQPHNEGMLGTRQAVFPETA